MGDTMYSSSSLLSTWRDRENFEVAEEFAINMTPRDRREIKRIIFEYFECIAD